MVPGAFKPWHRLGSTKHTSAAGCLMSLDHFTTNVSELVGRCFFHTLAAQLKLFVDLDGGFLHLGVSLVGTADKNEVIAARQAFVPVVAIQPNAQQGRPPPGLIVGSQMPLTSKHAVPQDRLHSYTILL